MIFVEVIINRPIRRSFQPATVAAVQDPLTATAAEAELLLTDLGLDGFDIVRETANAQAASLQESMAASQLFHYHLPPALETVVQPGHLIWAPFGPQEVQGVVVGFAEQSPVPTRAILRLARPEPVLTPVQMAVAAWIADYYVAPLAESVKLFFPPGLLSKDDGSRSARAKRELKISLALPLADALAQLPTALGRETQQVRLLAALLETETAACDVATLLQACDLKTDASVKTLAKQGVVVIEPATAEQEAVVRLAVVPATAEERLDQLRGIDKYRPLLHILDQAGALWKSELYQQVNADLAMLRALQKAGLVQLTEEVRFRDPLAGRSYPQTTAPPLTLEQQAVWRQIEALCFADAPVADGRRNAQKFLLHGVTGSGKTEIYLRSIAAALERGLQAIVLVPEIALTPQTVARFAGRFPGRVTVLHSGLSAGERYDVWRHLQAGEFDIVVGPRSALFAPLNRLGLIILDEEHEASYKQSAEEWGSFTVFYDARTVAEQMAVQAGAHLIFGSATPSLERYGAAQRGELHLLELLHRVMGHRGLSAAAPADAAVAPASPSPYTELPPVEIVDMRQELRAGHRSMLSRTLLSALHTTLDAGEQAIFYLNRRGTRTFVMCRDCGTVQECPRCEVPLTFHEHTDVLICHHCNRRYPVPTVCPSCESKRIKYFGSGTQRLEEVLQQVAPHARLMRWDADTVTSKGSHETILRRFANHEADILVGTQMIAKGLDFPLVTLVGVVAADVGLYLPDFRSGERSFQLLTQVAGRAGRGDRGGRVVIQSYKPEHYAIQAAAHHDYHAFYRREVAFRQEHGYPPVRRLARLIYWDKKLEKAQAASTAMAVTLRTRLAQLGVAGEGATVLGPAPAFFARYRGYYRWQVLLRAPAPAQILQGLAIPFGWRIDIDPVSLL
jgi:primosomal protein N' (replication factor Y)